MPKRVLVSGLSGFTGYYLREEFLSFVSDCIVLQALLHCGYQSFADIITLIHDDVDGLTYPVFQATGKSGNSCPVLNQPVPNGFRANTK